MAIEQENTPTAIGAAFAAAGSAAPRTSGAQTASAQWQQPRTWDFLSLGNQGGITRQASSEVLTTAMTAVMEILKKISISPEYSIHVIKADNVKEPALRLSSIVFAVYKESTKQVAYHTAILEASGPPIPPREESFDGKPVTIQRFSADVFNERYKAILGDMMTRAFPGASVQECYGVVCPRSFNWADENQLRQFVNNCILPSVADLESRSAAFQDINLSSWNKTSSLTAVIGFNQTTHIDYAGLPVRSDVLVTLTASSSERQDAGELNSAERSQVISEAGGFIDLAWCQPDANSGSVYGNVDPNGQQQKKFAVNYVTTRLENQMRMTIASQLLALGSVLPLGEGVNWYPYFSRPTVAQGSRVDMRDLGAINIEANIFNDPSGYGTKIDTKASTFSQLELGRLIQTAIRPGLSFSLDVSVCGSDTWYNDVFAEAALGNTNAWRAIVVAANTLTGGAFNRHYQAKRPPVLQNNNKVLMGYYTARDGARHDIREVDYLAVMNVAGVANNKAPQAFSDTYTRLDYDINKRLDIRKGIICDTLGAEVVFTQTAQRVTWDSEFLTAFTAALRECEVVIRVNNSALNGEYVNSRGSNDWVGQSAMGQTPSGLYSSGYSGGGAPAATRHNSNRW